VKHTPRKRFGQNFLVDDAITAAIIAAIDPKPTDSIVEIGPGLGALTRPLLEAAGSLHAIEIDRDLVAELAKRFAPRLTVHSGDVMKFDLAALGQALRVVGNLPYNISTPVLFRFIEFASHIRDIHVMLQREVVERMVAAPSDTNYGRLSVMLQYRCTIQKLLTVPAAAFRPMPAVESAVVRIIPLSAPVLAARDESLFARVVAAGFAQRRKTLRNSLRPYLGGADFAALAIDPQSRAQDLSVREFVTIANYVDRRERG
jgi:16S rRNA (adenine1518-N6/adenine1519-N6)-dimethyltransferase